MARKILKNKPLVEAIFELRWELQEVPKRGKIDPHYKLLLGRIYDKIIDDYPIHEELPTAAIPDEMADYVVQNRFRSGENEWPLVQIGPGVITINDTEGYVWDNFEKNIIKVVNALLDVYPNSKEDLKFNKILLRYIDAIGFNYDEEDVFQFLDEKMKTGITLYDKLFDDTGVEKKPLGFDFRTTFSSSKPKGAVNLRIGRAKINDNDHFLWETVVISKQEDTPNDKLEIQKWLEEAHELTDDWFFKLIEGDLEEMFK